MFNKLIKRIKSQLKWRKMRREQELRAASIAVAMTLTGALKRAA